MYFKLGVLIIGLSATVNGLPDLQQPLVQTSRQARRIVNGFEFNGITRGVLLHMLATMVAETNKKLRGQKKRPVYNAQFINNKFTKPFIYDIPRNF